MKVSSRFELGVVGNTLSEHDSSLDSRELSSSPRNFQTPYPLVFQNPVADNFLRATPSVETPPNQVRRIFDVEHPLRPQLWRLQVFLNYRLSSIEGATRDDLQRMQEEGGRMLGLLLNGECRTFVEAYRRILPNVLDNHAELFLGRMREEGALENDAAFVRVSYELAERFLQEDHAAVTRGLYEGLGLHPRYAAEARQHLERLPALVWLRHDGIPSTFLDLGVNMVLGAGSLGPAEFVGRIVERELGSYLLRRGVVSSSRQVAGALANLITTSATLPAIHMAGASIRRGDIENINTRDYLTGFASNLATLGIFRVNGMLAQAWGMTPTQHYASTMSGFVLSDFLHDPRNYRFTPSSIFHAMQEDYIMRGSLRIANAMSRGRLGRLQNQIHAGYQQESVVSSNSIGVLPAQDTNLRSNFPAVPRRPAIVAAALAGGLAVSTLSAEGAAAVGTRGGAKSPTGVIPTLLIGASALGMAAARRRSNTIQLRPYQKVMQDRLREDIQDQVSPWLAVASPMQTGKSRMIGPIIGMVRKELGRKTNVVILSSARIITKQLVEDLTGQFSEPIGRFDGLEKNVQSITVASVYSMADHLDQFPVRGQTLLINDEAYSTQSPTYRRIYQHFGLGEVQEIDGSSRLVPRPGKGLVIGLSGTGGGLEGYHVSAQFSILDALDAGVIRNMRGDRLVLTIDSDTHYDANGETMIWWRGTPESARALAEIYAERLHSNYPKTMVYVPTIEHGQLLLEALRNRLGRNCGYLIHSQMSDADFIRSIGEWESDGGPLISVRRLGRGFRAEGTHAVFHTYQTTSVELFAQRTGRAWARSSNAMPDLYVLEAAWNQRGSFANLARLLGLIDYPGTTIQSRNIRPLLEEQDERESRHKALAESIERGEVSPVFVGIPLEATWRRIFAEVLQREGGIPALSTRVGLNAETLAGFALGALPVRWAQVEAMQEVLGGTESARRLWVDSWQRVPDQVLGGRARLNDRLEQEILNWREEFRGQPEGGLLEQARRLDEIMERLLPFLRIGYLAERGEALTVRQVDLQIIRDVLAQHWGDLGPEGHNPRRPSLVEGWTYQELAEQIFRNDLSDTQWRLIWRSFSQHFHNTAIDTSESKEGRDQARQRVETLMTHFFRRQGWDTNPRTAMQRLLYESRRAVALRYGSSLPETERIPDVASPDLARIRRWLQGDPLELSRPLARARFFEQVRNLMNSLEVPQWQIDRLIIAAIFEERNWPGRASNAQERLLLEARIEFARRLSGHFSHGLEKRLGLREGAIPPSVLKNWLETGSTLSPLADVFTFFPMVGRFFQKMGVAPRYFVPLLAEAFEEVRSQRGAGDTDYFQTLEWFNAEYRRFLPREFRLSDPRWQESAEDEVVRNEEARRAIVKFGSETPNGSYQRIVFEDEFILDVETSHRRLGDAQRRIFRRFILDTLRGHINAFQSPDEARILSQIDQRISREPHAVFVWEAAILAAALAQTKRSGASLPQILQYTERLLRSRPDLGTMEFVSGLCLAAVSGLNRASLRILEELYGQRPDLREAFVPSLYVLAIQTHERYRNGGAINSEEMSRVFRFFQRALNRDSSAVTADMVESIARIVSQGGVPYEGALDILMTIFRRRPDVVPPNIATVLQEQAAQASPGSYAATRLQASLIDALILGSLKNTQ